MTKRQICEVCAQEADKLTLVHQCDFCGRTERKATIIITGPFGADICDECACDALTQATGKMEEWRDKDKRLKPSGQDPQGLDGEATKARSRSDGPKEE